MFPKLTKESCKRGSIKRKRVIADWLADRIDRIATSDREDKSSQRRSHGGGRSSSHRRSYRREH